MKLSYQWLGEMVDLTGTTPEEIQRLLTFHTAEIEDFESIGADLAGVLTARVLGVRPHPDADKLRLCTVQAGDAAEPIEVVCGAPNVAEGQIIVYAPVGITLPGGADGPIQLEVRTIRGVESRGMICSERELGLGEGHEGILVLPADTPTGLEFAAALGLVDTIFEIANVSITHRPDLWGHLGFARELGALLRKEPTYPAGIDGEVLPTEGSPYPISVEDEEGCRRYVGIVIENLGNGPSPLPLRRRLESLGVRSTDLLVDLTNLVLLEQGQPMHAFDLRDIRGGTICVRRATENERIKTLDGQERTLTVEDLVIADGEGPVAIAGVMGGENSEVRADTTAILLESATFDAVRVRRTADRLGLRTEASSRFEKELDPELAWQAALRFVALLQQYMPAARVSMPPCDRYPRPYPPVELYLPYGVVRRRLGIKLPDTKIRAHLIALGFKAKEHHAGVDVVVPSWRATKDIERPEDLVEEVGRIEGYDQLRSMAPIVPSTPRRARPQRALERVSAAVLSLELGYAEVKHRSFYGERDAERVGLGEQAHVLVRNPSSDEHDRMILTTAPSLLRTVHRNQTREARGRVWESARLFAPRAGEPSLEAPVMALASWDREDADEPAGAQFLGMIADLRSLLTRLATGPFEIVNVSGVALMEGLPQSVWLHPGRQAVVRSGERVLAVVGEVLPSVMRSFDLSGRCVLAEVDVSNLLACQGAQGRTYEPVLRFPVVPFDVAVITPSQTPASDVRGVIERAVAGSVRELRVFDVYEGKGIPEGQRSLALRCELFDRERTLTSKAADALRLRVTRALTDAGWTVRAG